MDLKPKKFQFPISGAFRQMLHSAQKRKKGGGKKKKNQMLHLIWSEISHDITIH